MNFNNTVTSIMSTSPYLALKIFIILGLILYVIFALVMARQVQLMSKVLGGFTQKGLTVIAVVHAIIVIALLLLSIIIL